MKILSTIRQTAEETIWPTRCVICETEGNLLCKNCVKKLKFIDINIACKVCGEPYGWQQCCGCSPVHANLPEDKRDSFRMEFNRTLSTCILDEYTGRIATVYKDAGERRLSDIMAYFMCNYAREFFNHTCTTRNTLVTYIPSTQNAIIRRGFDHGKLLACSVAERLKCNCVRILTTPKSQDQRQLNRQMRNKNMEGIFDIEESAKQYLCQNAHIDNIILVDDVTTTGATLNSAAKTMHEFGIKNVFCSTFARTF